MPWPKTVANHNHAQLVLPNNDRATKGLIASLTFLQKIIHKARLDLSLIIVKRKKGQFVMFT